MSSQVRNKNQAHKTHKRSYSGQDFTETVKQKSSKNITNKLQRSVCLTINKKQIETKNNYKTLFARTRIGLGINSSIVFNPEINLKIQYSTKKEDDDRNRMYKSAKQSPVKGSVYICFNQNKVIVQKNGIKHYHQVTQFINYKWIQVIVNSDYPLKNIQIISLKHSQPSSLCLKDIQQAQCIEDSKRFQPLQLIQEGNRIRALKFQSSGKKTTINWSAQPQKQNINQSIKFQNASHPSKDQSNNLRNCENKMNIGSNVKRKIFKNYQNDLKRKLTFDIFAKPAKTKLNQYFADNMKNIEKLQANKIKIQSKYNKQNVVKKNKFELSRQKNQSKMIESVKVNKKTRMSCSQKNCQRSNNNQSSVNAKINKQPQTSL